MRDRKMQFEKGVAQYVCFLFSLNNIYIISDRKQGNAVISFQLRIPKSGASELKLNP